MIPFQFLFRNSLKLLVAFSLIVFVTAEVSAAQTFASVIKESRVYLLEKVGANTPSRAMDLIFIEKPSYTKHPLVYTCTECFCFGMVVSGRYPELGLKPAFGDRPGCALDSPEFEKDEELAVKFQEMTRLEAKGDVLKLASSFGETMVFRMSSNMGSCLGWYHHEKSGLFRNVSSLAVRNRCSDPVQFQLYAPKVETVVRGTVPAGKTVITELKYDDADGHVYSACPLNMEPTVPFDERGFEKFRAGDYIRDEEYECR